MKLADCNTLEHVIEYWKNGLFTNPDPYAEEENVLRRAAQIGWERGIKDAADYVDGPEGQPEHMIYEDLGSEIREIPLPDEFKGDDV